MIPGLNLRNVLETISNPSLAFCITMCKSKNIWKHDVLCQSIIQLKQQYKNEVIPILMDTGTQVSIIEKRVLEENKIK